MELGGTKGIVYIVDVQTNSIVDSLSTNLDLNERFAKIDGWGDTNIAMSTYYLSNVGREQYTKIET